jgi:hypothetical protein
MAVELGGLRDAITTVADKLQNLRAAIDAFKASGVGQETIDEIQASVEGLGQEIDTIIADLQGSETPPEEPTPVP